MKMKKLCWIIIALILFTAIIPADSVYAFSEAEADTTNVKWNQSGKAGERVGFSFGCDDQGDSNTIARMNKIATAALISVEMRGNWSKLTDAAFTSAVPAGCVTVEDDGYCWFRYDAVLDRDIPSGGYDMYYFDAEGNQVWSIYTNCTYVSMPIISAVGFMADDGYVNIDITYTGDLKLSASNYPVLYAADGQTAVTGNCVSCEEGSLTFDSGTEREKTYPTYSYTLEILDSSQFTDNGDGFTILYCSMLDESSQEFVWENVKKNGRSCVWVNVENQKPEKTPEQKENIRKFVSRMYTTILNREAEEGGLNYWSEKLINDSMDAAAIAEFFINGDEFMSRDLDDSEYLEALYMAFFGRTSDEGGKAYWMKTLAEGNSRQFVMANFVNSNEFSKICASYGVERGTADPGKKVHNKVGAQKFALRMYTKALDRDGEEEGVNYWTDLLYTDQSDAESVAKFFIGSEEFKNKNLNNADYVEVLYNAFMDRDSDADGKAYWLEQMEKGMTKEQVLEHFARSPEFKSIMGRYGF